MSRPRIGVIGGGHLGRIHTRLAKQIETVEVVGVADPCPAARTHIQQEFGVDGFYDHRQLMGKIDAAIIAAPTHLHHEIAKDLLTAGIHTLIEKPMTVSSDQAEELVEIADAKRLVIQVGHNERFNPALNAIRNRVGKVKFIQASRLSGFTFRSTDVGVVLDLMIHDLDLVASLTTSTVIQTDAIGVKVFGEHEDIANARIEFADGLVANLNASRCSFIPQRMVQVFGTTGYASIDLANHCARLITPPDWLLEKEIDILACTPQQQSLIKDSLFETVMPIEEIQVDPVNAILEEQIDWLMAIQSGSEPRISGVDGLRVIKMAEAVLEEIGDHRWIAEQKPFGTSTPIAA